MRPFDPHTEDRSELRPHQAVNSKVGGGVEDQQEVHQAERREERLVATLRPHLTSYRPCGAEKPSGWDEVFTAEIIFFKHRAKN